MATIFPTSVPSKRLTATINASSLTIQLNNILGWDGVALTSSDFGTKLYCTLRNDTNTLLEIMELDPSTIASASITVLRRGLKFTGDLTTEVTANKLTWVKNQTIVELGSDVPQLLKHFLDTLSDQSVEGIKTFSSFPVKSGSTTPTSAAELATKAYVDLQVGGTSIYDQNLITGTAGETLVAGDLVYFKLSDSRWWKTDADAYSTSQGVRLGVAQGSAAAGVSLNILNSGLEKNLTGLTVGRYYVSNTAGGFSTTPGTTQRFVGWAVSSTRLIFAPDQEAENFVVDTAGEILLRGNLVYFKESDQKWWLTDADALATSVGVQIGIVQLAASADDQTIIRVAGIDSTKTGLTAGAKYYLSNTAGAIVATAPTLPRFVGYALNTQELLLASQGTFNVDQYGQQVYAASAAGSDTYTVTLSPVPVGYYNGMVVRFKVDVANTGPATLNVNGLGAISLVTGVSTALITGDILANQIVEVVYNSTGPVFQVVNPASVTLIPYSYKNGQTTRDLSLSSVQNIAHGLGRIPKFIRITALDSSTAGNFVSQSFGSYNGTTNSHIFKGQNTNAQYFEGGDETNIITLYNTANNSATAITAVATFDATNIILTWSAGVGTGTAYIMWEALA